MSYEVRINQDKINAVDALKQEFAKGNDYFFADYRGMSVAQITELRDKLRDSGATFQVVKNNYARIAFQQLGKTDVAHLLVGPTAVAVAVKDSAAAAKAMYALPKEWPMQVKGGLLGAQVYGPAQTEALSKLPNREGMYSMLMGTMQAVTSKFVRTLKAVADKKGEESGAAPVAAE